MIDLSIIIVSYNTRDLLHNCLASIEAGCGALTVETLVVDNASSDESAEMVRRCFPAVHLISSQENLGFAGANNVALAQATGRYLALLNPDTIVQSQALATLVRFMESAPSAGYCGPRLLNEDGTPQPSARRFPTVLSAAFSLLGRDRQHTANRNTTDLHILRGHDNRFRADWLSGACLLVRRTAVEQVGLLDDGYFLYFEETDWCRRMFAAGWEGWYVPEAEVIHLGGRSITHEDIAQPFSGDHPRYWVSSSRRYMRRYHGTTGMLLSQAIQVALYFLIWLRHCWRRSQQSRNKSRCARVAIRLLLTGGRSSQA